MCIVFDEGGRLPQDKHELYIRIVNTVLNSRYRDDVEGRERARYRLQAIAYGMHTGQGLGEARHTPEAEVSHHDLDRILREYLDKSASKEEGNVTTVAVREELLSQSGLFLGRGDNTAGFYHLSFQEFLAGQRLVDVENDLLPVFLERADVPEWHNTLSLLFAGLTREKAARLVTGLVQAFGARGPRVQEVAADCLDVLLARAVRLDAATEQTCRDAFLATMLSEAPQSSGVASGPRSAGSATHGFTTSACGACRRIRCWGSSRCQRGRSSWELMKTDGPEFDRTSASASSIAAGVSDCAVSSERGAVRRVCDRRRSATSMIRAACVACRIIRSGG